MTVDVALDAAQKVGLPIVLLAIAAALTWRLGGELLRALVEQYRGRIAALEADRDHFRARSEAADDRTAGLCRELIDEARGKTELTGSRVAERHPRGDL